MNPKPRTADQRLNQLIRHCKIKNFKSWAHATDFKFETACAFYLGLLIRVSITRSKCLDEAIQCFHMQIGDNPCQTKPTTVYFSVLRVIQLNRKILNRMSAP